MPSGVYYARRAVRAAAAGVPVSQAADTPTVRETPRAHHVGMGLDCTVGVPFEVSGPGGDGPPEAFVEAMERMANTLIAAYPAAESYSVHIEGVVRYGFDQPGQGHGHPWHFGTTQHVDPRAASDEVISALQDIADQGSDSPVFDSLRNALDWEEEPPDELIVEVHVVRFGWLVPVDQFTPGAKRFTVKPSGRKPKKSKKSKKTKSKKTKAKKPAKVKVLSGSNTY